MSPLCRIPSQQKEYPAPSYVVSFFEFISALPSPEVLVCSATPGCLQYLDGDLALGEHDFAWTSLVNDALGREGFPAHDDPFPLRTGLKVYRKF